MITNLIKNKLAKDKANIKGREIAKLDFKGLYVSQEHGVKIDIVEIKSIDRGVSILAKAWRGNKQLGFGKNGSVEIEKFLIYNPPILVDDPDGSIIREWEEKDPDGKVIKTGQRKLKEDPEKAMRQVIAHTVKLIGKEDTRIKKGKIGNTTSVFYPDANPESTTVDGQAGANDGAWSSARGSTGGSSSSSGVSFGAASQGYTSNWFGIFRAVILFDTTSLPDSDPINNAILSLTPTYLNNDDPDGFDYFAVVASTPASNTSLSNSDFSGAFVVNSPTLLSPKINWSDLTLEVYEDWVLNASGISEINKTGITKLGMREGHDIDNHQVANGAAVWKTVTLSSYSADEAGTSKDPKLVISHGILSEEQSMLMSDF